MSPRQAKNQQALIVGGALVGGLVLLVGLAGGVAYLKSQSKPDASKQPAAKTQEQVAQDKFAAEMAKIDEAKRIAAVDAQLAAIDAAEGRAPPPASFAPQAPTAAPDAAAPPNGAAAATAAPAPASPAATTAATPPAKAPSIDIDAATKVLGSVKQWVDVTRAPRIAMRKMQLQVSSIWLAADATGKRIGAPAAAADGAEPAAEAEGTAAPEAKSAAAEAKSATPEAAPAAKFVFIQLRVTNADAAPHSYASWNSLDGTQVILADAAGQPLEFIPPSATPGVTRQHLVELAPGQGVDDTLVFAAPQGPPGKLKLALTSIALVGNSKTIAQSYLGLEIPPAYLQRAPELTAGPADVRPAPAAPAAEGDPPPLATDPPAKAGDPKAPPKLDDFTKELEKDAEMKKKEGGFNEVGESKTVPNLPPKK